MSDIRISEWLKEQDLKPCAYASWVRIPLLICWSVVIGYQFSSSIGRAITVKL